MKELWTEFWKAFKETPKLYFAPIRPGVIWTLSFAMTLIAFVALCIIAVFWVGITVVHAMTNMPRLSLTDFLGEEVDSGWPVRIFERWFTYFDGKL